MGRRLRHFDPEEQAQAIARAQDAVWRGVVARFERLKATEGLRQADLAAALGVSRPQIHEWLSDPRNMTLKAAGRLLLAMDAALDLDIRASEPLQPPVPEGVQKVEPLLGARLSAWVLGLLGGLSLLLASVDVQAQAQRPRLQSLTTPTALAPWGDQPTVLVFWRADCGPCLVELQGLARLEAAAAPLRLATVALDAPATASGKLKSLGLAPRLAWRLIDDPATTLTALGGPPPRLPLTVAFNARGEVCGRRVGLLGVNLVKSWAVSCSR